tara:strand:- start:3248 stop:3511 length:264 start_codon:yes stop_codon:yes gene_type:complete
MKTKTQTIPKWFKGSIYETGDVVTNKFSGEEYELSNIELSMYDFIMGTQMVFEMMPKSVNKEMINDFHRGLTWFRTKNSAAYYALLD